MPWTERNENPCRKAERAAPARVGARRTDTALINSCQHGNKEAFELLVRKYQKKVLVLVSRRIHDSSEVPDVAQEVFLNAYKGLPNFRNECAFYTWLYRIAINTANNHFASKKRRQAVAGTHATAIEALAEEIEQSDLHTPERLFLAEEIRKTVLDTIEHLPLILREPLVLREQDVLSYAEISEVTQCPVGTVRSRIARAREAVTARLKPLLD